MIFLLLVGLLLFSKGFLPPPHTEIGFANELPPPRPQFKRMVFMVVDAMRSDFMFSTESKMPNVHKLLRKGYGYPFTAFSDPPTVTLPRLKGILTGSSPNFLDAVINIAESDSAANLETLDSWIHQLHSQNKKIHMFGDNTWLKLFPTKFNISDGTDSFFVSDFTEVDNNVTRHLDSELRGDYDCLVLHYLGLDHIGHKGGPKSELMGPKQLEMDSIIYRIFNSLDSDTLLVVLGDHGMNDVGNHGGASTGETSAALALFAKRFNNVVESPLKWSDDFRYHKFVQQVDLVPTLACLLGFPIPKNSLGVFIPELFNEADAKRILNYQCLEMGVEECTFDNLKETQMRLMRSSSEHVLKYMYLGLMVLVLSALYAAYNGFNTVYRLNVDGYLWVWYILVPVLLFVSMMGSSTVEEEHYFWYWVLSGILCHTYVVYQCKREFLTLMIAYRVIRGWNSTGQKWTSTPDVGKFLNKFVTLNVVLVAITSAVLAVWAIKGFKPSGNWKREVLCKVSVSLAAFTLFLFKFLATIYPLNEQFMIVLARVAFGLSILSCLSGAQNIGVVLIMAMQTKLANIPLWLFVVAGKDALTELYNKTGDAVICNLITLCFEFTCFFAFGGSNSLATVDLSNAYNGVSGYNIPLVGLLTYLGNWAPSLYFSVTAVPLRNLRSLVFSTLCVGVCVACLVLREHLFIWTVFSPKLLYVVSWLVFHEIISTLVRKITIYFFL